MKQIPVILCLSAVVLAAADEGHAKRPFVPTDYYSIETPGDPQISPNGKLVAYTVVSIDRKQNRKMTRIWVAPVDGSAEPRQFTTAESASSPRWKPDGSAIAFVSAHRDAAGALQKAQIYVLPMNGGEAQALTDFKNGVTAFEWSPDGTRIACLSRTGPSDGAPPSKDRSDEKDYVVPGYKADGSGFLDDRRSHVWLFDVKTRAAKQLSFGDERNDTDPQWSPDGRKIAFTWQRTDGNYMGGAGISVVPVDGGSGIPQLSNIDVATHAVRWSPDGERLAFIGSVNDVSIPKIWTVPASGGTATVVGNDVTYATELDWAKDGRSLLFAGAYKGEHPIFRIDLATKKVDPLTSRMSVRQFDVNDATEKMAYSANDDTNPGAIFVEDLNGGDRRQLTHLNAALLSQVKVEPSERLPFKGPDGWNIEGFFTKPADVQPGKTYPMILMIHGGPNGMWGYQWSHEVQAFASHGWAVLRLNPRGSSGYGEAFQRGVFKEWGGKAYQDIMDGVDAALAKYPWVDRNRLGVVGQSYGGFMTEWIVGHTDRFKAAVALAGISNFISVEGTRDGFYGHARDFGPELFDDFDLYLKSSPIRYAKNIKTPTLVLHGDADQRVPLEEGEQFFRALKHFNVPSEFVIFPREPHSLRVEPKHAVEVLEWQIYWFDRWVDGKTNAVKPNAISTVSAVHPTAEP